VQRADYFRGNLCMLIERGDVLKSHVARDAKVSRSHLDKILSGSVVPSIEAADRIADACGYPLEAMMQPPGKATIPA